MGGRWRFLATWRDAGSRRVAGWHPAAQMPTELVLTALEQALALRQSAPGLIIHADRGSPFASLEEARLEVAWYPDAYFNLDRRHPALGYRSPHQFEQDLKLNLS